MNEIDILLLFSIFQIIIMVLSFKELNNKTKINYINLPKRDFLEFDLQKEIEIAKFLNNEKITKEGKNE